MPPVWWRTVPSDASARVQFAHGSRDCCRTDQALFSIRRCGLVRPCSASPARVPHYVAQVGQARLAGREGWGFRDDALENRSERSRESPRALGEECVVRRERFTAEQSREANFILDSALQQDFQTQRSFIKLPAAFQKTFVLQLFARCAKTDAGPQS